MTIEQERARIADEMHHAMIDKMLVQSCLNCENWNDVTNLCKRWKALPPPNVIVYSCGDAGWFPILPF